jgi:integrase
VRNVHTTLRKALADAVAARRLDWNPAEAAKVPKVERGRALPVWSAADVARFLEHVAGDRLAALYVLAATTGLRRGELLGLRWQDVAIEEHPARLSVRRTRVQYGRLVADKAPKSPRSSRTIPLPTGAIVALRRHRANQAEERLAAGTAYTDSGLVFADEIGRPLMPSTISSAFARHVRDAGLPRLTLHGLRHTFATLGLEAGVDTVYVSELLGHASPAITMQVYQHTREERLSAAIDRVGEAIFGRG